MERSTIVARVVRYDSLKKWGLAHVDGRSELVWFHLDDCRCLMPGKYFVAEQNKTRSYSREPKVGEQIVFDDLIPKRGEQKFDKVWCWWYLSNQHELTDTITTIASRRNYWGQPWFVVFATFRHAFLGPIEEPKEFTCYPSVDHKTEFDAGFCVVKYETLLLYQDSRGNTWRADDVVSIKGNTLRVNEYPKDRHGDGIAQVVGIIPDGHPGFWFWDGTKWEQQFVTNIHVTTAMISGLGYPCSYRTVGLTNVQGQILRNPKRFSHMPWFYRLDYVGDSSGATTLVESIQVNEEVADWLQALADKQVTAVTPKDWISETHIDVISLNDVIYEFDMEMTPHLEQEWFCNPVYSLKHKIEFTQKKFSLERGKILFEDGSVWNVKYFPGGWTLGFSTHNIYRSNWFDDVVIDEDGGHYFGHAFTIFEKFSPDELELLLGVRDVRSEFERCTLTGYFLWAEYNAPMADESRIDVSLHCVHGRCGENITITSDVFGAEIALNHKWHVTCSICGTLNGAPKFLRGTMVKTYGLKDVRTNHPFGPFMIDDEILDVNRCREWLKVICAQLRNTFRAPNRESGIYITNYSETKPQGIYIIHEGGYVEFRQGPIPVMRCLISESFPSIGYRLIDANGVTVGRCEWNSEPAPVYKIAKEYPLEKETLKNSGLWELLLKEVK